MKKLLFIILATMMITSCSVNTSEIDDFDTSKISYFKDNRTGCCFAVVASRKTGSTEQSGLGITEVDCDKVKKYLKK